MLLECLHRAGLTAVALEWVDTAVAGRDEADVVRTLLLSHRRRLRTELGQPLDDLDRSAVPIFLERD